jgi:hypothetical protein
MNADRSDILNSKRNRLLSSYVVGIAVEVAGVLILMAIGYVISVVGFWF